ncbi:MAG: glutamate racemase [Alphaproteobacteria bacterium]|nr:glutamate racemase [Alphaproteobacteria bacterium]
MKLGVFDSGLGGILITRAIREHIPDIDILYLGDTLHVPYGNRSEKAIYTYAERCIDYLFKQDCQLIVMACNTASASALRRLQQEYLPRHYPHRRILGVIVPTIEYALERGYTNIGLIGTNYTVRSEVYREELRKINPAIRIHQINTPLLVPLIENNGMKWVEDVLDDYLAPLLTKNIETLILSCTHYVCLKDLIRQRYGLHVIAQDEIIPLKLAEYLERHPEISTVLSRTGQTDFCVTDLTQNYLESASFFYQSPVQLTHANIHAEG